MMEEAEGAESARRATAMALAIVMGGDIDPEQLTQALVAQLKVTFPAMPADVDYGALAARVTERCTPFLVDWFLRHFTGIELEGLLRAFQDPAMLKFLSLRTQLALDLNRHGEDIGAAWAAEQEAKWRTPTAMPQYGRKLRVRWVN